VTCHNFASGFSFDSIAVLFRPIRLPPPSTSGRRFYSVASERPLQPQTDVWGFLLPGSRVTRLMLRACQPSRLPAAYLFFQYQYQCHYCRD